MAQEGRGRSVWLQCSPGSHEWKSVIFTEHFRDHFESQLPIQVNLTQQSVTFVVSGYVIIA